MIRIDEEGIPPEIKTYFEKPRPSSALQHLDGRFCVIRNGIGWTNFGESGYFCGYTWFEKNRVPKEWDRMYDIPCSEAHGGVTFAEPIGDYFVIGFDCAHYGDENNERLKDPGYILEICKAMREELEGELKQ